MKWVDIWALQKFEIMQNDSITGLACLIGYVHSLLIVWLARTKNQSLSTEIKYQCNNGKTRLFHSQQSILMTKDKFALQATETFFFSWLLMHSLPDDISCSEHWSSSYYHLCWGMDTFMRNLPINHTWPRHCLHHYWHHQLD